MKDRTETIELIANWDYGVGKILPSREWLQIDAIARIDILKDWIFDLEKEYEKTRKQLLKDYGKIRKNNKGISYETRP